MRQPRTSPAGPETKLDRLLETWRVVAERLSKELDRSDDDSLIATSRVVADRLGKELDRSDGASLIAKSRLLVDQTGDFFRSSDKRFDEVHDDLRDVFGETPSERRALRRKANELLDSADALTSRVGDTFMGRLLIRSEQRKSERSRTPEGYFVAGETKTRVGNLPQAVEFVAPPLHGLATESCGGAIVGRSESIKLSLKLDNVFTCFALLSVGIA